MLRISKKLIASAVGSLALVSAVACEQRTQTPQSDPATTTTTETSPSQEPNALRPSPSTSTPGATTPGAGGTTSMPSTAPSSEIDTQPVRGVDSEPQGSGGTGGQGGQGGRTR